TISLTAIATVAIVSAVEDDKETDIFEKPPIMIGDEALLELLIPPTPVRDAYERRLDVKDDRISELKDEVSELESDKDELESDNSELESDIDELTEEVEYLREEINELDSDEDVVAVRDDVSSEGNNDERPNAEDDEDSGEERTEGEGTGQGETFVATYYVAMCDTGCTGVTASGLDVSGGKTTHNGRKILAADPSVLPIDTVVKVTNPDGSAYEGIVKGTGGDVTGQRLDVLVGRESEAVSNGRHDVRVEVIG